MNPCVSRTAIAGTATGLGCPQRNIFLETTSDSSQLIIRKPTRSRTVSTQEIRHQKHELVEYAATLAAAVLSRHNGVRRSHSIMPRELLRSSTRTLHVANDCILLAHTTVNNASTPRMACVSSSSHQNAAQRHVDQADHHANMNGSYMDGRTIVGAC